MITSWKAFNFKSIRDETELALGPLTIFAGANSSGKSTLIQSVLLIAQTLANRVGSRSVVLNGALTSLGQFDDLKSIDSQGDQIAIEWTCRPISEADSMAALGKPHPTTRRRFYYRQNPMGLREVSSRIAFDADPSNPERDVFQIQPRLFSSTLDCVFPDEDNVDQRYSITVRNADRKSAEKLDLLDEDSDVDDSIRAGLAYDVILDDLSIAEVREEAHSAQPIGCVLRHFLPTRIIYSIDPAEEDAARAIAEVLQNSRIMRSNIVRTRPWQARDLILSSEILKILKEILKNDGVDLDELISTRTRQTSLFETEGEALHIKHWDEMLRSVPREQRLNIQQTLQDSDDLAERISDSFKQSASSARSSIISLPLRPREIFHAARYLDHFFSASVKYLGPLRDAPKPLYPLASATDPYDVGLRGEHTAFVLEVHKNRQVQYIPSSHFELPTI